jgi:hypothetical protein
LTAFTEPGSPTRAVAAIMLSLIGRLCAFATFIDNPNKPVLLGTRIRQLPISLPDDKRCFVASILEAKS